MSDGGPDAPSPPSVARSNAPRDPSSSIARSSLDAAVAANNAFTVDLYGRLRAASGVPSANLVTTPLSASIALTMTYAGARNATATQMASALRFGGADAQTIFDGQNVLTAVLGARAADALAIAQRAAADTGQTPPSPDDYALQLVNAVWGERWLTWEAPFLDALAKSYGTGVYLTDFKDDSARARSDINAWVSASTSGKIATLLPVDAVAKDTRMVLVDALHLKLPWANAFAAAATAPGSFTRADGSTVTTPFMNRTDSFTYVDDGDAQVVVVPLAGGALEMHIALPHGDLAACEGKLSVSSPVVAPPKSTALVALSLPKFEFSAGESLVKPLTAMGSKDAFESQQADFSGLCAHPDDPLFLSDVVQQATIAVQETGIEAAGATAVVVSADSGAEIEAGPPATPIPMVVDRPFVVSIVDAPTGAVLFLGHVVDPNAH